MHGTYMARKNSLPRWRGRPAQVCICCIYSQPHNCVQGSCQINNTIELPALKIQKQVKSLQMFHNPVNQVTQGDRAAICVTQLNSKLIERGLAAAPGTVPTFSAAVAAIDKVRFYAGAVQGKAKYHLSIGHATVMAEVQFFGVPDDPNSTQAGRGVGFCRGWTSRAFCGSCIEARLWSEV